LNFQKVASKNIAEIRHFAGVDSSKFQFDDEIAFDALITSPPYLQAQEYIRTSKLDLGS